MSLAEMVAKHLEECGTNPHTRRAKEIDLRLFSEFAFTRDLSRATVEDFVSHRLEAEAPASVNRRLATLKAFFRYANEVFGLPDFARSVRAVRTNPKAPQWLSLEERERLLKQLRKEPPPHQLVVLLQLRCGLRRSELALRTSQVDFSRNVFVNVRRKGNLVVRVFFPESVAKLLRRQLTAVDGEWLLPGRNGKSLSGEAIYEICERIGYRARIEGLNPHRLRHTFIREIYEKTNDLRLAADAAGHADVKVTMRYTGTKENELAEAIRGLG
jgi:integrase